jgi:hypothetical protein
VSPYRDWPDLLERATAIVSGYDTLVTLRQLFYRLVAAQLLPNSTNAYKSLPAIPPMLDAPARFPP